jgi:stringent starvation protein B
MMTSKKPYLLRAYYDWITDNQLTPYILVNAQYPGVNVPTQYVRDGKIILDISAVACRGLEIDAKGVQFSARFSGQLWQMAIPLAAIQAIYAKENSQGMTFGVEDALEAKQEKPQPVAKKPIFTVIRNDESQ